MNNSVHNTVLNALWGLQKINDKMRRVMCPITGTDRSLELGEESFGLCAGEGFGKAESGGAAG